jgi:hypothetical protein
LTPSDFRVLVLFTMHTPSSSSPAPDAAQVELTARRMAAVDQLVDVGMALAEALRRQVAEPEAPRVFGGDLAMAYARIARAVRLTILLAERLEQGLPALAPEAARAASAGPVEAADNLEADLVEREWGERGEREADESVWLKRPISALAAQICRDLDAPYDAELWADDIPGPYPRAEDSAEAGSAGQRAAGKSLGPRLRGDERKRVDVGEYRPP